MKKLMFFIITFSATFGILSNVYAMHIMEGYLAPSHCIVWSIISLPFLFWGFYRIQKLLEKDRKNITLLAMAAAFIFVISSLKIPSVTGSCSHMTGTALGAILFGASSVAVLGMLAHGGLTTLGANVFSMAIAGPFLSYAVYKILKKCHTNTKVSIFIAAFLGDFFTYCITSIQLAFAYPSLEGGIVTSIFKFLGVFAPTQLPLAVIEGILTVIIMIILQTYALPEMKLIGFEREV